MSKIEVKIFELYIDKKVLNIGIRVRGEYNIAVRNPNVTLIFKTEGEDRRIPMPIQVYHPENNLKNYYFFAGYKYKLPNIFWKNRDAENIELKIEVTYGTETFSDIVYGVSKDLKVFGSEYYDIELFREDGIIKIKKIAEDDDNRLLRIVSQGIKNTIALLWKLVLIIIAIILFPVFFVEALLSMFDIVPSNPDKKFNGVMKFFAHLRWRTSFIIRNRIGFRDFKIRLAKLAFFIFKNFKVKSNRVTFISNRRDTISGNYEYIYKHLVKDSNIEIKQVLETKEGYLTCFKFGYYLATSKVILVDDYIYSIYEIPRRKDNYLIQVWHACGAFKTFGFSRIGRPGGQKQTSKAHRNYDFCTVSSSEICKFYAEGFGLSHEKVVPLGVPRTDIFFSKEYKEKIRSDFYKKYEELKDKKIILFAPTFRGMGKRTGHYPKDRFDFIKLYEHFKGEYAIIIKHHPFVNNRVEIPKKYSKFIIDMSDNEELNDLLFVTDILITDYSSVVFEASLLNIPMLFYAFDLQSYIADRGFYYEYDSFVPGKIVSSMKSIMTSIEEEDFEKEKIQPFKNKFFDELDGMAGLRVARLIEELLTK